VKLAKLGSPKAECSASYVEYGAHTNIAIYEKEVTLMGDHI
jgi:hypothetical protein